MSAHRSEADPAQAPLSVCLWSMLLTAYQGCGAVPSWLARVQGMLMPLPFRERLTMLMPPSLFYRRRMAQEARSGEPELAVLAKLVAPGGTAIDVGANVGFFAYATSRSARSTNSAWWTCVS
jgi:hypothetical protein